MSNYGVSTGFAKCFILFMAVVILVQGGVHLGLSIWGITLRKCSKETADISSKPLQFASYLIYFLNEDCGNPSIKVPGLSESITLDVDFGKAEPVQNRTLIFCITYAVISSFWVLTSLAIITTLCGPITKTVNVLCVWPWFLAIMAGSILDAAATGYHIYDIINTTSVVRTFKYLGITANEKTMDTLSNFDTYFVTPAVIMTCVSSRFIFIWLLNIFGSSFCLSLSNTLSKRNSSKQCSITSLASTSTYPIASTQQMSRQDILPAQTQQQQIFKRSKSVLAPTQIDNFQGQSSAAPEANQDSRLCNVKSPTVSVPHLYPSHNESHTNIDVAAAYGNDDAHPDKLNYSPERNAMRYHQELSPLSPLNNRYSTTNESFQFPMQNQRVSEELRGQLPWSYTSMPPPVPKTHQVQIYPEIPAPDYVI